MKSVAFHIQKGGVGKTTLTCSVSVEASKKSRTIIVDVDPQGNTSSWLLSKNASPNHELADVLYGKVETMDAICPTHVKNLDILPTFGLDGDLKTYGENQLANEPFIFLDLFESLSALGYDYAFLDLSPGMGRLERSAVIACDEVITPMTPEAFSLDGIQIFVHALEKASKAMRRSPIHNKIVINGYNRTIGQHNTIYDKAKLLKGFKLYTIGVDTSFMKSQAAEVPVQFLKGKDRPKPETIIELKKLRDSICQ